MPEPKERKTVFVIMPFTSTPTRDRGQLTAFYENTIKSPIEKGRFKYAYKVQRSDDTFNITEQIIKDLFDADVVICDLSGKEGNPNVMYELGIRLAFSNKPVILLREAHKENRTIFDIGGFYAHPYDPLNTSDLVTHLKTKLKRLETGEETYKSPVLKIVAEDIPLIQQITAKRAKELLDGMAASVKMVRRVFATALAHYIARKRIKVDISESSQLLETLQKHAKLFNATDWSNFNWEIGPQPTIDYYLANQYLNELVEDEAALRFTAFLTKYHATFLSTSTYQGRWGAGSIHAFVGESQIVLAMLILVRALLFEDKKERRVEMVKQIKDLYEKESHI